LRGRIALQVDGQLKTGRDVLIGALLGRGRVRFCDRAAGRGRLHHDAQVPSEYLPGRRCDARPRVAQKFTGQPEHVVNYFFFVAEEARELMAQMGIRKFDDLIGRSDLLGVKEGIAHWKSQGLDFSKVFHQPDMPASVARRHAELQDHELNKALDNTLIAKAQGALKDKKPVVIEKPGR